MNKKPIIAFLYDFDKTLCTTDMQDYTFIPSLGYTPGEFWSIANSFGFENRMDGLLAYMYTMIEECRKKGIRACCCSDSFSCEYTRRHNDANALCMGGRVVGAGLACQLVDIFLNTEFEGGRHQRRIDKLTALENR